MDIGKASAECTDGAEVVRGPDGGRLAVSSLVVVCDGHASWVGLPAEDRTPDGLLVLAPAWSYVEGWPIGPAGQIARVRGVVPLEQMASATRIECRPVSRFALAQLDSGDRELFAKMINDAEKHRETLRNQARAARSGITLPQNGSIGLAGVRR